MSAAAPAAAGTRVPGAGVERICRLTPLQDGMFFEALRKQGSTEVVYQVCVDLRGPVSPALLREAWHAAVHRHAILCTSFHYERLDAPVQVTRREVAVPWTVLDWRGSSAEEAGERFRAFSGADREQPFELSRAPLLRLTLIRVSDDESWLVWTFHHLLLDGWSAYLVLADVMNAYRRLLSGALPEAGRPRPFWEYIAWSQRRAAGAEEFWRERLAGFGEPTPLGYDNVQSGGSRSGELLCTLPAAIRSGLAAAGRRGHLTPATLVQAAWALTLSRYAGQQDVVFGSIVSGRAPEFEGIDDMAGLFINVIPVRARVDESTRVIDWLREFQTLLADARQYDSVPLSSVLRWCGLPTGVPLFESLAAFINYPVRKGWTEAGETEVAGVRFIQEAHYPLHLTCVDGEAWQISLGYDARRLRRSTVERIRDLFVAVLAAFAAGAERTVGELPRWNPTALLASAAADDEPPAGPVLELVRTAVARRGSAGAVSGTVRLSLSELFERAERLADRVRSAGLGPGAVLAVRPACAADEVVAYLAALCAGAVARVPGGAPGSDLGEATGVDAVLVSERRQAESRSTRTPRLSIGSDADGSRPAGTAAAAARPGIAAGAGALAALQLPVGAQADGARLTQQALAHLAWWLQRALPLAEDDRVLWAGPADRPERPRDLLWTVAAGACLVDAPEQALRDAAGLIETLERESVTVLGLDPRQAEWLKDLAPGALPTSLRRIVCSPGPLPQPTRSALARMPGVELVEEFASGTAHASSVFAGTSWPRPRATPSLGRRGAGHGLVLPDGPAAAPDTWAIEVVLLRHHAIRDAAVRERVGADGAPELTAYLVADEAAPAPPELSRHLADRLPGTRLPDTYRFLDALRLNADGSVDEDALAASDGTAGPAADTALADDAVVELLRAVWSGVFEVPPAELTAASDFFTLGGHSLLAIRLVSRTRAAFGTAFSLNDLFGAPTIGACARTVRAALRDEADAGLAEPIPRAPRDEPLPASFAQERVWLLDQVADERQANNILLPTRIARAVDAGAMRLALTALADRHEVLRTLLREQDGRIVQIPLPRFDPPFECHDLSELPLDVAERQARALLERAGREGYDLAAEPPLRAQLIKLAAEDHVLGLCLHHGAMDAWSSGVLLTELAELYAARLDGRAPTLAELPVQYADFSVWQRRRLDGERLERLVGYWRERLAGAPPVLDLAPHRPRPARRSLAARSLAVVVPPETAAGLLRLAQEENGTPFMVLLAAYAELLGRRAGRDTVVVGVPVAGRIHHQLEAAVGFLVNTLPLRVDLDTPGTFRELVRQVRAGSLAALAHEELPFEKLVAVLSPERAAHRLPVVQIGFNFQSSPSRSWELDDSEDVRVRYFPVQHDVAGFDLAAECYLWRGGVRCVFKYAVDAYDREFVERFAAEYLDIVEDCVRRPDRTLSGAAAAGQDAPIAAELQASSRDLLRNLRHAPRDAEAERAETR